LFGENRPQVPEYLGLASVSAIDTKHLLTPGKGRTAAYDYTLNPYRGCTFGCEYCYAAFFVPDDRLRAEWGKWVHAKVEASSALRRRDLRDKRIYMSSVTDPYQPLEAKLLLTREIVEILGAAKSRLVVQTRSPLVARDADLFRQFAHVRVNISITTDDDSARRRFEPGCPSIERRLAAAEALVAAGVKVVVCICPMLPMSDPETFGRRLARLGISAVTTSWFHSGDRAFAAGTREGAWNIAQSAGWTHEGYEKNRDALRRYCSVFASCGEAFGPV
jgi:DNA repair photolyase